MKLLSPEVALYLYKSAIQPCMGCCCHAWAGAPSCYLELLNKLQKRICRTIYPSLAASFGSLVHRRNVVSLGLFYRYYFGRCLSELVQLVTLPYSRGDQLLILIDCMIFLSSFLDVTRMSVSTVSFFSFFRVPPCMEWTPMKKSMYFLSILLKDTSFFFVFLCSMFLPFFSFFLNSMSSFQTFYITFA